MGFIERCRLGRFLRHAHGGCYLTIEGSLEEGWPGEARLFVFTVACHGGRAAITRIRLRGGSDDRPETLILLQQSLRNISLRANLFVCEHQFQLLLYLQDR